MSLLWNNYLVIWLQNWGCMKKNIFFLFSILLIAGCASKRYTKQGEKFEEAGLYKDAANYYYEAVSRKNNNLDAKLGLRKNGQLVLDNKIESFTSWYKQSNYQQAVFSYMNAENYYKKVKKVGVDLDFPDNIEAYYEEAKAAYLETQYIKGLELLEHEEFKSALRIFEGIMTIDGNYKDVKEKFTIARYEPKYREGIAYLDNEKYRTAYYTFDNILKRTDDYKQSYELRDEAREKATLFIVIDEFSYVRKQDQGLAGVMSDHVRESLSELNNPFLQLVDPGTIGVDIYKMNGKVDMQAARLAGINAIFSAVLQGSRKVESKVKETIKKGYVKEVIKLVNDQGVETESITYHKTNYTEFEAKNEASLKLTYKMVSTQSEILFSGRFDRYKEDELHYAEFDGDKNNLIPGYWKYLNKPASVDVVNDERKEVKVLKNLLVSKRQISPANAMFNDLVWDCIKGISSNIDRYNPED